MTILLIILHLFAWVPPGRLVDEAVARIRKPKTVRITGTVRDWNGRPMAGVTVTATTEGR